jgi:ureidoacrylate peracid hydrolase
MQMNYKSSSWADGNAALIDAEHKVTLNNMVTLFADVMTTQELGFLDKAAAVHHALE